MNKDLSLTLQQIIIAFGRYYKLDLVDFEFFEFTSIMCIYIEHILIASSFLQMPICYKDILTACTSLTKSFEQFGKSYGSCPSATL